MRRKRLGLGILILIIAGVLVLVIANRDFLFEKYQWHRAKEIAEKRQKELMVKFEKKAKLSSMEIGRSLGIFNWCPSMTRV